MGLNDVINSVKTNFNLSSITDVAKSISVAPQDFQGGIGGFLFSMRLEENLELESQITDYLIEENSSIEDNIALSPLRMTLSGVVAELVYSDIEADILSETLKNKLGVMDLISPSFSTKVTQYIADAKIEYQQLMNAYEKANNIMKDFSKVLTDNFGEGKEPSLNTQQKAFNFFYSVWRSRQLVTVETPWAIFGDCAIEGVSFKQGAQSTAKTELTVKLKVLNFAKTKSSTHFGVLGGRSKGQGSGGGNAGRGSTKQKSKLWEMREAMLEKRKQSTKGVN